MLFFTLGALAYSGRGTNSVVVDDGFWKHFFAPDCSGKSNCRDYLVFTVPTARAAHIPWQHGCHFAFGLSE